MTGSGPQVAGRYRLLSRIGGGGMGAVWLARDELLGRQVALKQVLPPPAAGPDLVEQQRQRALREGRIAARLSHPHAIAVYDVVVEDGSPWLVMEYLPSRSLAEVLQEDGVLSVDPVAQIGAQVADALTATHDAGIVHRDVKPANILIGKGPGVDGMVKITDFGISHARGDVTLTQTGQITGTPAFLAPEVAQGEEMTPASDVFSLGATLYTCLEGEPPFGLDDNPLRLLHRVAAGELRPPQRAGSLTEHLTRMLAVQPDERPDLREVRDRLARVAAGRDRDPTTVLMARTVLRAAPGRAATARFDDPAGAGAATGTAAGAVHVLPAPPGVAAQPTRVSALPAEDVGPPGSGPAGAPAGTEGPTGTPGAGAAGGPPVGGPPAEPPTAPPSAPATRATPLVVPRRRRRRPAVLAGLVLVALLAGLGGLWLATRGGDGTPPAVADPAPSSSAPTSAAPSDEESAPPATGEPGMPGTSAPAVPPPGEGGAGADAPAPDDPATAAQATLEEYYARLPDDPGSAYAMTGPSLRRVADYAYYEDFFRPWREVELVSLSDVRERDDGRITATTLVEFVGDDGRRQVERHAVTFVRGDDGRLLVDLDEFQAVVG